VVGYGGDDDPGLASQGPAQLPRGAVVQSLMPPVLDDQLGQNHRDRERRPLGVQRVDVARERRDDRTVGRFDDLKRQMVTQAVQ
jgi:hypothetical protein